MSHVNASATNPTAVANPSTTLLFAVVLAVLTADFWWEAWTQKWVSDTMWRARLWIPYSSMPIGLTLLALQGIAELFELLSGRAKPFGSSPDAEHLE